MGVYYAAKHSCPRDLLGLFMAVLFVVPGLYWWFAHTKIAKRLFPIDESLISATKLEGNYTDINDLPLCSVRTVFALVEAKNRWNSPSKMALSVRRPWLNISIA